MEKRIYSDLEQVCNCRTGAPRTAENHPCHSEVWHTHPMIKFSKICTCCVECEYRCYMWAMDNIQASTLDEQIDQIEDLGIK